MGSRVADLKILSLHGFPRFDLSCLGRARHGLLQNCTAGSSVQSCDLALVGWEVGGLVLGGAWFCVEKIWFSWG